LLTRRIRFCFRTALPVLTAVLVATVPATAVAAPDAPALGGAAGFVALAAPRWLTPWAFPSSAFCLVTVAFGLACLRILTLHRDAARLAAARSAELARLSEIDRTESVAARLAKEKASLELLRYQLNPHFLFNALNSIRARIHTNPPAAADMVSRLADFARLTLTRPHDAPETLGDELDMLATFLSIEQARWEAALQLDLAIAPGLRGIRLPAFLLLVLVENAVKYGVLTSPDRVHVRLTIHRVDAMLVIEVANFGEWIEPSQVRTATSTGIGLDNLRQRLAYYYPDAHEFTVGPEGDWVVARLRIPATERLPSTFPNA